ncbi:MAG: hypothetical protein M5U05_16635 [Anaerolineales bacterium]|nr:hypothetical protein [Anaerolineales bacterium]
MPANSGRLMLAGVSPGVMLQLKRTGLLDEIGEENVFLSHEQWGVAAYKAYEAAQAWLDEAKPQTQQNES